MQVQLVQQEVSKHFTKTAITLCQEVCQEVANNSEWRAYGHSEWLATSWQSVPQGLPILEVVASGKQPWRHRVYLQACMSRTYCITPKAVLASVQHSINSMHTRT